MGIKNNVLKTYQSFTDDKLYILDHQLRSFHKMVFSLTVFHSSIIERSKYGAIGFSNKYNFNESDLDTAILTVRNFLEYYEDIPFDALRFMIGNIVYGGKITD